MTTTIRLSSGVLVVVDPDVFDVVNQYRWYLKKSGWCWYACRNIRIGKRIKTVRLHRVIWELVNGPIPDGHDIHHVKSDTLDCKIGKLECIEHKEHGYF